MTRASDTAKLLGAGATILDGTTISTADNTAQLTLTSTDADSNSGPLLTMYRNSSSPADSDFLGDIAFQGENSAGETITYSQVTSRTVDVTDGTEDGRIAIKTMRAGASRSALDISATEIIFNDDSEDVDFRVESNGNANMLFVDGGNDAVVVGQAAPETNISGGTPAFQVIGGGFESFASFTRRVASSSGPVLFLAKSRNTSVGSHTIVQNGDVVGEIAFHADDGTDFDSRTSTIKSEIDGAAGANDTPGRLVFMTTADGANSPTERLRINAEGNILSGLTGRLFYNHTGTVNLSAAGDAVLKVNRSSDTGNFIAMGFNGTQRGQIGSDDSHNIYLASQRGAGIAVSDQELIPTNESGALEDNVMDVGHPSYRFDDVRATNGTIQTSDRNDKQDIEELTDAEKRVAVVAKGLMRKFRWKDNVAEKGDKARTHFGIIAQDLQDAFTAESLDASKYAMFCSDTWWEKEISVDAVEADEEKGIEAKDAYTYMDTKQEATSGYTEKTRLGVRYSELLAFIISAI